MSALGLIDQLVAAQPPAQGAQEKPKSLTGIVVQAVALGALAWAGGALAKGAWDTYVEDKPKRRAPRRRPRRAEKPPEDEPEEDEPDDEPEEEPEEEDESEDDEEE